MALEEHKDIFEALLKPMMNDTLDDVEIQLQPSIMESQDPDEMPLVVRQFKAKGKFSK